MNSGEGGQDPADSAALGDRRPLRDVSGYLAALVFTIKLKFKRDSTELTRVADVTYSVEDYRMRMRTYPKDHDDIGILISERGLAWLYVVCISIGSMVAVSVLLELLTGGHWVSYRIPAYTFGTLALTAVFVDCVIVIRLIAVWYLYRWVLPRAENEFDSMWDAEKSWNSLGGRGYSPVVRWLCIPSNLDVVIGFSAAVLVMTTWK